MQVVFQRGNEFFNGLQGSQFQLQRRKRLFLFLHVLLPLGRFIFDGCQFDNFVWQHNQSLLLACYLDRQDFNSVFYSL